MADMGDKAREEFFSEAHEIIEGLSRDLLQLDSTRGKGPVDPELVNNIFRAVHTLKGLAGLFGATRMSALSHELENVLDDLRLGKIELTQSALDLLFRGVTIYGRILAVEKGTRTDALTDIDQFLRELAELSEAQSDEAPISGAFYELDPGLLAVLTEYEEHRLRTNIEQGQSLFRLRVRFELATIDGALSSLKTKAKPHGEIITYLPTGEGAEADSIELDILMASKASLEVLRSLLGGEQTQIEEVPRRSRAAKDPVLVQSRPGSHGPPEPTGFGSVHPPTLPPRPKAVAQRPGALPKGAASSAVAEVSLRSVTQTVRVDIRKLDLLMNIVGELSIVRNAIGRLTESVRKSPELREIGMELYRLHRGFERQLADLQSGILEVRMVPLGQLFDKLARVVRQISREADKDVNLVITGAETEVDKLIVEELSDPLMHMIRNAIDHAIEARIERERVGKPAVGTIALNAFQKASHVVIEVEDDGKGIDETKLVSAAVKRGLLAQEEVTELVHREVLNLVFIPGLSTKSDVGELSGRGVGMDVVKTNIGKLGGIIDIYSERGIGTKFTVTLPITLAIISALIVQVEGRTFAVPLASVQEAIWLDPAALRRVEGQEMMTLRGATLPLCRINELFSLTSPGKPKARPYAVVVSVGARRLGLVVDELIGQQDIVIKPLGPSLKKVKGFAGATELGDQRVALVLDAPALIEELFLGGADAAVGSGFG
ncbi:MAG TPA: chemotaxis protein CheA [Polyangiaceae bacterium]|jgi:two-component system chemotaxis sensor kinase CheA|nr:chemotaxis protein CheA [Polyangiaceae bacterium]